MLILHHIPADVTLIGVSVLTYLNPQLIKLTEVTIFDKTDK